MLDIPVRHFFDYFGTFWTNKKEKIRLISLIREQIASQNLHISKKSCNFAPEFEFAIL